MTKVNYIFFLEQNNNNNIIALHILVYVYTSYFIDCTWVIIGKNWFALI